MVNNTIINYEGKDYERGLELLGNVEKIRWFEVITNKPRLYECTEVFDQDLLDKLEMVYETVIMESLLPVLPLI